MGICCCKKKNNENIEKPKKIKMSKGFLSLSSWKKRNKRSYEILLLGLEGVGKTTIGYWSMKMKNPKNDYPPTIGVQKFKIDFDDSIMKLTEIGGSENIRSIWHHYFVKALGCIFVIDVSEYSKVASSVAVLCNIMNHEFMIKKPFVILLTKSTINTIDECDFNDAFGIENMANNLEIPLFIGIVTIDNHKLLFKSLLWLKNYIDSEYYLLNERLLNDIFLNDKLKEHAKWVLNNPKILTLKKYRKNRKEYEEKFLNSITNKMDKNFINYNRRPKSAPVNVKKILKKENLRPLTTKSLDKNFKCNKINPLNINNDIIEMKTIISYNKNNNDINNEKITGTKRKIINNQMNKNKNKNKNKTSLSSSSINAIQNLNNSHNQIQSISGTKSFNIDNSIYENLTFIESMINYNDPYNLLYNKSQKYDSESTDEQFNSIDLLQVQADIHYDPTITLPSKSISSNNINNINHQSSIKIKKINEPIYMNIQPPLPPIKSKRLIKSAGYNQQSYKVENWLNDNHRYLLAIRSREIGIANNIMNIVNKRKLIEKEHLDRQIIKDTSTNIEHLVLHGEEAKAIRRLAIEDKDKEEGIYEYVKESEDIENMKQLQNFKPPSPPKLKFDPETMS